jgi:hypothetical protein
VVSTRDWAQPPQFTPLSYRLTDVVDGPRPFTGHQKLGVTFEPNPCTVPLETTVACVTGTGSAKAPTAELDWRGADPFVVYTWLPCGLVSLGEAELRRLTLAAHQNNAPTAVERVFWSGGDFATAQFLAANSADARSEVVGGNTVTLQTGATTITGTYDVVEAIGLLEEFMAGCYGGTPLIHVPRRATPHLAAHHQLTARGGRLVTTNGSVVVPAPGYPLTGPDGTAAPAGHAWFYATGAVAMWQSEPMWTARSAREYLGRATNETTLIVEQWFMLGWDCCHYAVLVNLGGVVTGGVNSAT